MHHDPVPAPSRARRRRRLFVAAMLVVSLGSLGAGLTSLAVWTDSDAPTGAFTAGSIDITASPSTLFTVTGIVPGDTGSATLNVENSGTAELRYALTSSSTNDDAKNLRDQLELTIREGACAGGTVLSGPAAIAGAGFGDPTQGGDTGDRVLAAGAEEDLCFAWSLPSSTGNSFQGAATTTSFTFAAEQTSSNP
jgi:predicted ribosomally synthesized peptide with SipW-like signal peptide